MNARNWAGPLLTAFLLSGTVKSHAQSNSTMAALDQPTFHLLLGGDNPIPGGTYALNQRTSALNVVYEQPHMLGRSGIEFLYQNEGYLGPKEPHQLELTSPLHYRDGIGVQLDYWIPANSRCRLGAAAGPEMDFDTSARKFRSMYDDRHSGGVLLSVFGQCRVWSGLGLEIRANHSYQVANFNSTTVIAGLTYTPGNAAPPGASFGGDRSGSGTDDGYLAILLGKTQVDDFRSQVDDGFVEWIKYGHRLSGPFGYEVSLMNEKIHTLLERNGIAAQATLTQAFANERFTISAGLGPELAHTEDHIGTADVKIDLLVSVDLTYHFRNRIFLLLQYAKVADNSGRTDTDMVLAGCGFDIGSRAQ